MLLVIPCGEKKAMEPTRARDLYLGSMFKMALRAAEAIQRRKGGVILILSGRHGLVELDATLAPYEQRMGRPGCITQEALAAQAKAYEGEAEEVVVLAGKDYALPAKAIWPEAQTPLLGLGGIGYQRQALSRMIAVA